MRWAAITLGAVLFLTSLAGAASAREPGSSRRFEQWKKADSDGDGQLSRAEAAGVRWLRIHFDAIDRNGDGRISTEEVRAWRGAAPKSRRRTEPSAIGALFDRADSNADGALSRSEAEASWPRVAARFDAIDSDGDGRLSREELSAWLAARRMLRSNAQ